MTEDIPICDVMIHDTPLSVALVLQRQREYGIASIVMTNVPHLVIFYSSSGFEFGYDGKGPRDL